MAQYQLKAVSWSKPVNHAADEKQVFGDVHLDAEGGRFLYRFHAVDGVNEYGAHDGPVVGTPTPDFPRLYGAAGFDGRTYWVATFRGKAENSVRARSWRADTVIRATSKAAAPTTTQPKVRPLQEGDGHGLWMDGVWVARQVDPFSNSMPLHVLLHILGCKGLSREEIEAALRRDARVKQKGNGVYVLEAKPKENQAGVPGHWQEYDPWPWDVILIVDGGTPALKRCVIGYAPWFFTGSWPYETPTQYALIRQDQREDVSEAIFDFRHYSDGKTRIIEWTRD